MSKKISIKNDGGRGIDWKYLALSLIKITSTQSCKIPATVPNRRYTEIQSLEQVTGGFTALSLREHPGFKALWKLLMSCNQNRHLWTKSSTIHGFCLFVDFMLKFDGPNSLLFLNLLCFNRPSNPIWNTCSFANTRFGIAESLYANALHESEGLHWQRSLWRTMIVQV